MRRELGRQLGRGLALEARRLHAVHDQLLDVAAHELLFGRIEVTVDIPERGQVEDDRPHLLLRLGPTRAELEHPPTIQRPQRNLAPDRAWPEHERDFGLRPWSSAARCAWRGAPCPRWRARPCPSRGAERTRHTVPYTQTAASFRER